MIISALKSRDRVLRVLITKTVYRRDFRIVLWLAKE